MKIITVIGARPQFIKASPVSRALLKISGIEEVIVHTGQHYDANMSEIFFQEMDIPVPRYFLNINSLGHGAMTGQMLEGIERILIKEQPDMVLVYGDTNSTLAGALAACKLHIPVAHIESGLRSHNLLMPEEYNRVITDRISSLLFVPTNLGIQNLVTEGFNNFPCKVIQSGDVMLDAALYYSEKANLVGDPVKQIVNKSPQYCLATIHRQENTNDHHTMSKLIRCLNDIHKDVPIILPMHPRTKKIIANLALKVDFCIIDPVGYIDMLYLVKNSGLVITDSGGLQKESYFMNKYCLTIRTETEWTELVDNGFNFICGSDETTIKQYFQAYFGKEIDDPIQFYGHGDSSRIIAENILMYLRNGKN